MAVFPEVVFERNRVHNRFAGGIPLEKEVVVPNWKGASRGHVEELQK